MTINTFVSFFFVTTDDYLPDAFSFLERRNVAIATNYVSDTITLNGLLYPTVASVENGRIIKNGQLVEDKTIVVVGGDQIALQNFSSGDYATVSTTTVRINTFSAQFSTTTDGYSPKDFDFPAVEHAELDSFYTSKVVTLTGLPYATPITLNQGRLFINDREVPSMSGEVVEGDRIVVRIFSGSKYETEVAATVQIGSLSKSFIVRTKNNPWQWKTVFPSPVKPDVKFSIDGKVYAGGYTQVDGKYNKDLYVYDPSTDDWKITGILPFHPKNGNYTAVIKNRAYCLHMSNFWNTEFWEYNADINKWTARSASLGNDASLQFSGSLINDNQVLYFYYYKGGGPEAIWKYTPSSDTWQKITTLPASFVVKPGTLLLNQRILIAPIDKYFVTV